MFTLPAGMIILSFHNNWVLDFPVFITLAGWVMTLKSLLYLFFPDIPAKRHHASYTMAVPRHFPSWL